MSRKFSNTKINEAGAVLTSPSKHSPGEIAEAQDILTYWRTIHAYPINTFQSTLRDKIKRLNFQNTLVAQRLKRAVSIVSKLERINTMKLSTMQDIAGLRAILSSVDEVRALENNYRKSRFSHVLKEKQCKDYITYPAPSGYRGIHLVYQYVSPENKEFNGLRIELQIRTKLQHIWATAVETIGTFLNHSLKSSQGPQEWLEYFELVSAGFSVLEHSPVPSKYFELSEKEIFKLIIEETVSNEISKILKGFTVAADHIYQNKPNSKYNLITLNIEKRTVNIRSYSASRLAQANIDYTNIEKQINEGAKIQAVLVSTGSIESLRKAYPSYFLDAEEFLEKLREIYKQYQKM